MKSHAFLSAFGLVFLSAGIADEGLRFGPDEGTTLVKNFSVDGEIVLDAFDVAFNGEEVDPAQMGMPSEFEASFGADLRCTDEYESVADGRPVKLLRTFEELTLSGQDNMGSGGEESYDDLIGEAIRFEWDDEAEAYDVNFVDGGDDDLLAVLNEDLDLRALLPDDEEASDWDASGLSVTSILVPGFDLTAAMESDEGGVPAEVVAAIQGLLADLELTCSNGGVVEEDGAKLARISLEGEFEKVTSMDPSDLVDEEEGQQLDWDMFDITLAMEMEGEALWDVEANHFRSFEMRSEGNVVIEFAMAIADFGLDIEGTIELSLSLEHVAEVEVE